MATKKGTKHNREESCIIEPMEENGEGEPVFRSRHVVDATIVGNIAFFSLLLGTSITQIINGNSGYLTLDQIQSRFLTAMIAFFLTFFAQWAKYRGIQFIAFLNGGGGHGK